VLPKIYDIRSEITTQALAENGWTVNINEEEESYKVNQLEKEIFIPERNQLICEQFLKNALRMPESDIIGRSVVFAVNQRHATELTKILNSMVPGIALTITSRVKDSSEIAKDFRDGKRKERVAVSVDMLSTGYNCPDILNIVLARPIFSPTEYIQIKGRGTRLFKFTANGKEYKKEHFLMLDFCGVAEFFQDKYDYTVPLTVPREAKEGKKKGKIGVSTESNPFVSGEVGTDSASPKQKPEVPVWTGTDIVSTTEIKIVGPNGEKVDVMTFRGSYERDLKALYDSDAEFKKAVDDEDDDRLVTILDERFFGKPQMYYTPGKLIQSYGIPAPVPTFVYGPLNKRPMPTKELIVEDTVQSIAARYNLRFNDQRILNALAQLVMEDPTARKQFLDGELTQILNRPQFAPLGGLDAIVRFDERESVFEALRETPIVRQAQLAE
jgi:type I restriction enzyme R subunit